MKCHDHSVILTSRRTLLRSVGSLALAMLIAACAVEDPTNVRFDLEANLAKGGPSGITVTSVDPDTANQGDVQVSVRVKGSGFAQGAKATWSLLGDTNQVVTNSTTFVSSSELIALVTVSATAPIASYDITVTNIGGKKGVGAELFAVKPRNEPPVLIGLTVDDTGPSGAYHIQSDGLGEYVDGQLGVFAQIDIYGNLQITSNMPNSVPVPARTLPFDFSDPVDPLNTYRPPAVAQWRWKILSNKVNNGNPRIQDMSIGAALCYNFTIAQASTSQLQHVSKYNALLGPVTYVHITRTGATTWDMVTNGPCTTNLNVAELSSLDLTRPSAKSIFRGYYRLSFSMHLRAL